MPNVKKKVVSDVRMEKSSEVRGSVKGSPTSGPVKGSKVRGSLAAAPTRTEPKKYGEGEEKTIRGNKANVSAEQLKKSGLSLRQYMNKWNKTGKRP